MHNIILILLILPVFLIIGFFVILAKIFSKKRQTSRALNMSLFLIKVPKESSREGEEKKPEKEIIAVMEQLYSSLSSIKEPIVLEIANPSLEEEIYFYIALGRKHEQDLEKDIHGFFPKAEVLKIEDYNIFNPQGAEAAAYLKLKKRNILPIKTYQELESDPLSRITTALSKLEKQGEGAAIQILIKPAADWKKAGEQEAKRIQETSKIDQKTDILKIISETLMPKKQAEKDKPKEPIKLSPLAEETIKKIEAKTNKTGFNANIRLVCSAATQDRAEQILEQLTKSFTQFDAPNFNGFKIIKNKGRAKKKSIFDFSFRNFNPKHAFVLNTEELTSLYHFPISSTETPKLKWLKTKQAPAPANMPDQGIVLGKNIYRGQEVLVRLTEQDRQRHLYIIGQTGTGKSSLMQELIQQDIEAGKGVGVIDPHGELIENILGLIPGSRAEDVVLFDPSDLQRPMGLNMLEYNQAYPEQKTFIVNELINIFDKLYDLKTTGGPIFEQYTRNALLLLMDDPKEPATLMEVPKALADKDYRHRLLAKCRDPIVKNFWEKEAEKAGGEAALVNMVPYITSKFNIFIANDYMRPIIGQAKSSLNFREIMDQKKILLVNLSKGRLGDINSALLGLIIVGKILMTAFSRADIKAEQRPDFYFYLDEFQNFTTPSIAVILSEARKYKLDLILAHQFIGQLTEEIKKAVFGNVGNMICLRVGPEDAEFLVKQFEPVFNQNDLINIDNFNSYVKLQINGQTTPAFSMQHLKPKEPDAEIAVQIKELSRFKYGQSKEGVEREILERIKL